MATVQRTDAANLTVEELGSEHPDGGRALARELAEVEKTLSALPRSGKELIRAEGISLHTIVTRSGNYQVVYTYAETEERVEVHDVIPTRSSVRR